MSSDLDRRKTSISVLSNFANSRTPEEYEVDAGATAGDLVRQVLARHNMLSKDPHLLYVTLDTLGPRGFAESVELKEDARLLQRLQLTQRTAERQVAGSRQVFVMHMRSGGLLKIHDSCIMPGSFYNSLYVSTETTTAQVIALLLASYGCRESAANFRLVAKDAKGQEVRRLSADEFPLTVQQQSHGEFSIHLKRAVDIESVIRPEPLSRSETLTRLQDSFRDLQRLRQQNPELYDKLLIAGGQTQQQKHPASTATLPTGVVQHSTTQPHRVGGGFHSARAGGGDIGVNSQFRHSARLPGQQRQRVGNLSARTTTANAGIGYNDDTVDLDDDNDDADYWFPGGGRSSHRGGTATNRSSVRGGERQAKPQQQRHIQPPQPQLQPTQQQSKRQLPQLPSDIDIRARRLKLELEAQRQLVITDQQQQHQQQPSRRDFQCQAFEEAGLLGRTRTSQNQPSLREILAVCETRGCQLARPSRSQAWGVRWQEVQFGDVNGNHQSADSPVGHKPAIGKRQGAFHRNERLLKYMRTLVAVQSLDEGGAAAGSDLRPDDLIVELNGCLATGMAPDQIDSLIESQLTLDLLVARQPQSAAASLSTHHGNGAAELLSETGSGLSDRGDSPEYLRQRLSQLQLQCNELISQSRVNEQVIQRLKGQLTKTARVCLLQHTDATARPGSHAQSERSFQVIDASRDSPVTSAV